MRLIDERVLAIIRAQNHGVSMGDIATRLNAQHPPGYGNDILSSCLRRLTLEHAIWNPSKDLWLAVGQQFMAQPELELKVEQAKTVETAAETQRVAPKDVKKCNKCSGTSFFPSGGCRTCQAANEKRRKQEHAAQVARQREAILAKAAGQAAPKPPVTAPAAPSEAAPPIPRERLIRTVVMLKLKDADGELHSLFFAPETVKQLAIELQEYV